MISSSLCSNICVVYCWPWDSQFSGESMCQEKWVCTLLGELKKLLQVLLSFAGFLVMLSPSLTLSRLSRLLFCVCWRSWLILHNNSRSFNTSFCFFYNCRLNSPTLIFSISISLRSLYWEGRSSQILTIYQYLFSCSSYILAYCCLRDCSQDLRCVMVSSSSSVQACRLLENLRGVGGLKITGSVCTQSDAVYAAYSFTIRGDSTLGYYSYFYYYRSQRISNLGGVAEYMSLISSNFSSFFGGELSINSMILASCVGSVCTSLSSLLLGGALAVFWQLLSLLEAGGFCALRATCIF